VPVLILLAIVWAIVLVPPMVRNRVDSRPGSSVTSFRNGLDVLGRAAPGSGLGVRRAPMADLPLPGAPTGRAAARRRRRDVLVALAATAAFTFLLALAFGGILILLHLAVDVVLAGYVYLLVQMRKLAGERSTKVRYLGPPVHQAQPRLVTIRRTAG